MPPPYIPGAPHRQHLPLPHYLQPPGQAQTHTQTHTPTPIAVTYPYGSAKSHTSPPYSSIYIVLCVQFCACTITCTQLLYHTHTHAALRFLANSWRREAQLTGPPGRAAVHTPEAQAGSKDSYFPGVVSPRNLPPGLSH